MKMKKGKMKRLKRMKGENKLANKKNTRKNENGKETKADS